jgi:hypothetical protein
MLFAMKDDANAPIINALVTRNDRGTEDVHLMAAGHDGDRLAKGIEIGFMSLLNEHMAREAFSGHIQIVVLSMTPPDARKQIPKLVEHLRGICNDVSKDGTKRYRVTLTFQKDSQSTSNAPPATAVPAAVAAPTERTKRHRAWVRPTRWVVLLAVAPLLYVAFNWPSVHAYPNTIEYGTVQLSQATRWQRSGTSAAVYVPPGEEMPDASLQLGVLVSAEHATAADLLAWIRDQSRGPDNHRYHDSGTASETCVVGVSSQPVHRTYLALQMCKTGKSRAACVEWDHVLEEDVFGSCQNDKSCFDDECSGRWQEQRDNLDSVLACFLSDAKNTGAKAQVRAD